MATEIDLAALLAPHEGANPAGADLREDVSASSLYFRIRDARSEARAAERAADTAGDDAAKETEAGRHWREVSALSREALSRHTKDIEIAAWLTEALVRSDGIAGLAAGAALLEGLAAGFWDQLYPMPDEDGIATRVAAITGLNGEGGDGTLIQPLRKIALFSMPDGAKLRYFEFRQSEETAAIADPKRLEARRAAGVRAFDSVEAAGRAAGRAPLAALRDDIARARAAWAAMAETCDRLAGADAPPTGRVGALLAEIAAAVQRFLPDEPAAPAAAAAAVSADPPAGGQPGVPRRAIESREDALALLSDLAAFFRRAEPQSPLAYTIDEAVRRARMTWPELLQEVITDDDTRRNVLLRLGIRPAAE